MKALVTYQSISNGVRVAGHGCVVGYIQFEGLRGFSTYPVYLLYNLYHCPSFNLPGGYSSVRTLLTAAKRKQRGE